MSKFDELEKIANLKKKGIISKEEFEEEKQKLLKGKVRVNKREPRILEDDGTSPKSRVAYALFGFFFGGFGVHNFYLGYSDQALAQLFLMLFGQVFIWGSIFSESGLSGFNYAIGIICSYAVTLWVGLNLLCIQRDGEGRLLSERGNGATITFGVLAIAYRWCHVLVIVGDYITKKAALCGFCFW